MTYAEHNATCGQQQSKESPRRESRDAYQIHPQRFTQQQIETAARLSSGLRFA